MTKKDKMQLTVIGVVILGVLGFVVYTYRSSFIPQPTGDNAQYAAPKRLEASVQLDTKILERSDFTDLSPSGTYEISLEDIPEEPSVPSTLEGEADGSGGTDPSGEADSQPDGGRSSF